jgi:hypothetical protein
MLHSRDVIYSRNFKRKSKGLITSLGLVFESFLTTVARSFMILSTQDRIQAEFQAETPRWEQLHDDLRISHVAGTAARSRNIEIFPEARLGFLL